MNTTVKASLAVSTFDPDKIVGRFSRLPRGFSMEGMIQISKTEFEVEDLNRFQFICDTLGNYAEIDRPFPSILDFVKRRNQRTEVPNADKVNWSTLVDGTPMRHQIEAVERVVHEFDGRGFLALDMGLGKGLIACMCLKHYYGESNSALIVCPGSKRREWKDELKRWVNLESEIVKKGSDEISKRKITIASFDLAKVHEEIVSTTWRIVIVDESQKLKGSTSLRSNVLVPLIQKARCALLLSGTPQESRPSELYNQLACLHPGVFGTREEFTSRYCDGHYNQWGKWEEKGAKNVDELHLLLSKTMIRLLKSQVLTELPPKTHEDVRFDLDPETVKEFDRGKEKMKELKTQRDSSKDPLEKERLNRRRDAEGMALWRKSGTAKLGKCLEWFLKKVRERPQDKFVAFCWHETIVENISNVLLMEEIEHVVVTGKTSLEKRHNAFKSISDPEISTRVAVLTMGTCAEGVTLSPGASIAVFFELTHVPASMYQAEDRMYRMNTVKPVEVYWLIGNDTYDDTMLSMLRGKTLINERVLDGSKRR